MYEKWIISGLSAALGICVVSFAGRCAWHRYKDGVWQFSSPDEIQKISYRRQQLKKGSFLPEQREEVGKEIQELADSFISRAVSMIGLNGVNFADVFNGDQDHTAAVIANMCEGVKLAESFRVMGLSKLVPGITPQNEEKFAQLVQYWLQYAAGLALQSSNELLSFLDSLVKGILLRN